MSEGIKHKYIADYKVILPCDNLEKLPIDGIPQDTGMKSMFLVNGMLDTGSRRCIVYMNSHEECKEFENVFKKVCNDYHGLNAWFGTIISNTLSKERDRLIEIFQTDRTHNLWILLSVRILDEAVNIPMCDSTFIASVGKDSSDIRLVQRMCRGSRLHPKGMPKINNLFLWSTDLSKNMNIFTLLRDEDVHFHKKIKIIGTNYNTHENEDVKHDIREKRTENHIIY
jgi:superfamily II DNA or RNA helicase